MPYVKRFGARKRFSLEPRRLAVAGAVGRSVARRAKDVEPKAFTDAWEEALDGREGLAHASCGHSKLRQRLHRAGDVHGARRSDFGAAHPQKKAGTAAEK